MVLNPVLLASARKQAFVNPAMMGGAAGPAQPADPAAAGAPAGMPAGGAPPTPPMPPTDPAMAGGAAVDPAMAGGAAAPPTGDPAVAGAAGAAAGAAGAAPGGGSPQDLLGTISALIDERIRNAMGQSGQAGQTGQPAEGAAGGGKAKTAKPDLNRMSEQVGRMEKLLVHLSEAAGVPLPYSILDQPQAEPAAGQKAVK